MTLRLAVLASGTGSLLEAMIEQSLPIELVLVDRSCRAFDIARRANLSCVHQDRTFRKKDVTGREAYTRRTIAILKEHRIDLVAMAGFMTVFSPCMFEPDAFRMRILNTHPSLLPSFTGDNAVQDALDYGVKVSGFTIHWATADLDAGPIMTQESVKVLPGDTRESLHGRIKEGERALYPALLAELIRG
ncbi:MAG: phosphoribosylglycinamide formyltransferase 1 [Parcubacteria bacterium C7867-008]|nr:MAG: phosphoribosylglycinamide formyltransferase 1 [Parcubacteria bacterium C7867-008]